MAAGIPEIEVAHDRDTAGIRRPDGKAHARNAIHDRSMGAQGMPEIQVAALRQQIQVQVSQGGRKGVGVLLLPGAAGAACLQLVMAVARGRPSPEPIGMEPLQRSKGSPAAVQYRNRLRPG